MAKRLSDSDLAVLSASAPNVSAPAQLRIAADLLEHGKVAMARATIELALATIEAGETVGGK